VVSNMGHPIAGCDISLVGTSRTSVCDSTGAFTFPGIPESGGTLLVRRIGYRPALFTVSAADGRMSIVVALEPGAYVLPDLVAAARGAKPARYAWTTKYDGFFERRRIRGGTFLTQDQIDTRPRMRTLELLQGIPGIRVAINPLGSVEGSSIDIARCSGFPPKINVYVDGVKLRPEQDTNVSFLTGSFNPAQSDPAASVASSPRCWTGSGRPRSS